MRVAPLVLVVALGSAACKDKGGGDRALGPPSGSGKAVVTYQPSVRVLEQDEGLGAIVGISTDGWTLVFDGKAPKLQGLKVGDIVFIKSTLVRKIVAIEAQPDGDIAALTQSPTMGEAFKDADIEVQAGVRFTRQGASRDRSRSLLDLLEGTAHADQPAAPSASPRGLTVKATYKGWEAVGTGSLGDHRLNFDVQITKSIQGFKAVITLKGWVQDFDVSSQLNVHDGVTDHVRIYLRNLHGRMDATWSVAKESPGGETGKVEFNLPPVFEIPLAEFLGGVPLFLSVTAVLVIQPAITGGSQSTKGAFHVTYSGTDGFEYKKGSLDTSDSKIDGDTGLDSVEAVSAAAPVGMVLAFAAPRFELSLGVGKVFKGEGVKTIKKAAARVDEIADNLLRNLLGEDGLAKWKSSPLGGFSIGKAAEAALASDATAWLQFQVSTGMTASGAMAVVPCRKTDIHVNATVGVGAEVLGNQVLNKSTIVWQKDWSRVEPSNLKVCQ